MPRSSTEISMLSPSGLSRTESTIPCMKWKYSAVQALVMVEGLPMLSSVNGYLVSRDGWPQRLHPPQLVQRTTGMQMLLDALEAHAAGLGNEAQREQNADGAHQGISRKNSGEPDCPDQNREREHDQEVE